MAGFRMGKKKIIHNMVIYVTVEIAFCTVGWGWGRSCIIVSSQKATFDNSFGWQGGGGLLSVLAQVKKIYNISIDLVSFSWMKVIIF